MNLRSMIAIVIIALAAAIVAMTASYRTAPAAAPGAVSGESLARREHIDAQRLGNSDYCGHCHEEIFHQWNASAHHFSSFNNPVYRRVAVDTALRRGKEHLQFCARCHDPLPLLANDLSSTDLNRWAPNAGITCLACHRITQIHGPNGAYTVTAPFLHPFALSEHPWQRRLHTWLLEVTPSLHRSVLSKPFYASSEYCATCHTVLSPGSINGHEDLVLQDEYSQWQRSPYGPHGGSGGTLCRDCHMPLVSSKDPAARDGLIRSHRFTGGNTLLPWLNRDAQQLQSTVAFLQEDVIRLQCTVAAGPGRDAVACDRAALRPGDVVDIVIRIVNSGAGHDFPAGTSDSNEAWLEVRAVDRAGRLLLHSGGRDEDGDVDANAHFLRTVYVDKDGAKLDRRTATTEAVAVASSSVVEAGGSRAVTYRLAIPQQASLPGRLEVRLNWRKYSPTFLRWVFGSGAADAAPLTTMAELSIELGGT